MLKNLLNPPLLAFVSSILLSFKNIEIKLPGKIKQALTVYILFGIGLKGGGPLVEHWESSSSIFFSLLTVLVFWGLIQPAGSYYLLKKYTRVDSATAAAIAASFGSVSVMTFVSAISFLDQLDQNYEKIVIPLLAIMEIPAIISGIALSQLFHTQLNQEKIKLPSLIQKSLLNEAILAMAVGLGVGGTFFVLNIHYITEYLLVSFVPLLCLFLFEMGSQVGRHRSHFSTFSWSLNLFGIYTPLIGGIFGLIISYLFKLDVGTGTLVAVLTASASYIAVPAAMKVAIPSANQAIFLPLSLGIAFPFNVIIGIPLYYQIALIILN